MSFVYSAVCAMVRDESDLREWVAYHLAVGFDHIFVYDNESMLPASLLLRDLVATGKVSTVLVKGKKQQVTTVYPDTLRRTRGRFRWVAFVDGDEFILPHDREDINSFLSDYEQHQGIGVNWQIFGDNGHVTRPPGLVIENYTRRSRAEYEENRQIKCIVSPQDAVWALNPHAFNLKAKPGLVNPDGNPIRCNPRYGQAFSNPPAVSRIQVNHYFTRSADDFLRKQRQGGGAGIQRKEHDFARTQRYCNEVSDVRILRFSSRTREIMGKMTPNGEVGPRESPAEEKTASRSVQGKDPLIFRILPPPPFRSPKAIETHQGLEIRDLPSVQPLGGTSRDREIAASMAHAGVMKAFLETGAPFAVVLEDDALVSSNRTWMRYNAFDLFLPYSHNRFHRAPDTRIRPGVLPYFGAFAYLCSREFAKRFLPLLLAGEVVDHAMPRAALGLKQASYVGNLVNHDNDCVSLVFEERRRSRYWETEKTGGAT